MLQVVLDVETKKTFEEVGGYFPGQLEVSFVGVNFRQGFSGQWQEAKFFEPDLKELFPLLEKADIVIGFNIDNFDMPALAPYYNGDISQIPTLDLLLKIKESVGHRISLDAVAHETLNIGKSGNGLDAIRYFKTGQLEKLAHYCLQDVKVTREIYLYGLRTGKVKFKNKWNRLIECPVDFSFKTKRDSGTQMSLI